jgi:hypothetical protein
MGIAVLPFAKRELSHEEIIELANHHLLNGIGFTIAQTGLDKTQDLARLLLVHNPDAKLLETIQNIVSTFTELHVSMDVDLQRSPPVKFEIEIEMQIGRANGDHMTVQ